MTADTNKSAFAVDSDLGSRVEERQLGSNYFLEKPGAGSGEDSAFKPELSKVSLTLLNRQGL